MQSSIGGTQRRRPSWHRPSFGAIAVALAVTLMAGAIAAAVWSHGAGADSKTSGAISPFGPYNGEGATVMGMTEYEARDSVTNGVRTPSGAIELEKQNQYLQVQLTARGNAVDVNFVIRQGSAASLAIYVNGVRMSNDLALRSSVGNLVTVGAPAGHVSTDARMFLGRELAAGDKVRFQAAPHSAPLALMAADFYQVPAPARPPVGSVSVVAEGADPTGHSDSAAAFRKAIDVAFAEHKIVWIPSGVFRVGSPLKFGKGTIEGAGDWYSQIIAGQFIDNTSPADGPVTLSGFAILGPGRVDGGAAAISGSLGSRSTISSLWIQDTGMGLQLQDSGPGLTVQDCEIFGTGSDGLSLLGSGSRFWLENNFIRDSGDDGIAILSGSAGTVSNNTVVQPLQGNGIAEYGGAGNVMVDNVVADAQAPGSGIAISNGIPLDHGLSPLAGTIIVADNTVLQSGGMDRSPVGPTGAIRVDAYSDPIQHANIDIEYNTVDDSPYSAFEIASSGRGDLPVTGLSFTGDVISGTGAMAFEARTRGSASISHVKAKDIGVPGVYDAVRPAGPSGFRFAMGKGNSGWAPTPVIVIYPSPHGSLGHGPGAVATLPVPMATPSSGPSSSRPANPRSPRPLRVQPVSSPAPVSPATSSPAPEAPPPAPASPHPRPSGPPVTVTALGSKSSGWRYMVVSYGADPTFYVPGLNDSRWLAGREGFGTTGGECRWNNTRDVKTAWAKYTDILVRHGLSIPEDASDIRVHGTIDNDASVYFNGHLVQAVSSGNCTAGAISVTIPGKYVKRESVLAIRGHDIGGNDNRDEDYLGVNVTYRVPG
jgi:parallel beta-helix repeat protein